MGSRYSKIRHNLKREIVLLKSFPCTYGKCSFCNYIQDNSTNEKEIDKINKGVLENITGEYGKLEVINSGSVFELTKNTLEMIREIVYKKNIKTIYFEVFFGYIKKLDEIKNLFPGVEVKFKMGIETFDNNFRRIVYNKNFKLDKENLEILGEKISSICLLICTKGQTKEMIEKDIELGLRYFKNITLNIFINNGTKVERDDILFEWFMKKYSYLKDDCRVELLIDNKDLGVFEQ